jgi:hypothetical protein
MVADNICIFWCGIWNIEKFNNLPKVTQLIGCRLESKKPDFAAYVLDQHATLPVLLHFEENGAYKNMSEG